MTTLSGAMLANGTAIDRNKTDFYPTPPAVTTALLNYLNIDKSNTIWEPACGAGHMAEVIKLGGYNVVASELHSQGYGISNHDFINDDHTKLGKVDWIITNPPFKLSVEFINKSIEVGVPFAMLLKSQYWHSKGRIELFNKHRPSHVLPLTWRPDFHFGTKGGSPTMECIWVVWDKVPAQFTNYDLLVKP